MRIKFWINTEGDTTGTVVDPKLIYSVALKTPASYIVLAHNHPSRNFSPSHVDLRLTKNIVVGKLLEITVLDHLILNSEGCYYFADEEII